MPVASNPVFPTLGAGALALPFTRTPFWKTLGAESLAGIEVLQQPWTYPRYHYKLNIAYLRAALAFGELQTLQGFYNSIGGRYGVFQFDDTSDDTTIADQSFGLGDGTTTTFQLLRARGGFVEPVFAVNTVINLKVNGVAKSNPADYSVSNKGIVTFVSAPAAAATLTWTGTYLWFCRFDQDEFEFNLLIADLMSSAYGPVWNTALLFTTIKFGA